MAYGQRNASPSWQTSYGNEQGGMDPYSGGTTQETPDASIGLPSFTGLEGDPVTLGNGITYDAYDAGMIAADPYTLLDATLRGQDMYNPGNASYYQDAYRAFPTLYYMGLDVDANSVSQLVSLSQQYQALVDAGQGDSPEAQAIMDQMDQTRMQAGLTNQNAFDASGQYLDMLRGGGIDPTAAMGQLFSQGSDPNSALGIILQTGTPEEKVKAAIEAISATLVTANPYMANLFLTVIQWMGRQYRSDPTVDRGSTSFLDYVSRRSPTPGNTPDPMTQSQQNAQDARYRYPRFDAPPILGQ